MNNPWDCGVFQLTCRWCGSYRKLFSSVQQAPDHNTDDGCVMFMLRLGPASDERPLIVVPEFSCAEALYHRNKITGGINGQIWKSGK